MDEDVGHVVTCDIDTTDLVHSLHPGPENHAPQHSRRAFAGQELEPGIRVQVLSIKDVFDNVELGRDGWRRDGGTMALESGENLIRFIVSTLSNKKTRMNRARMDTGTR